MTGNLVRINRKRTIIIKIPIYNQITKKDPNRTAETYLLAVTLEIKQSKLSETNEIKRILQGQSQTASKC